MIFRSASTRPPRTTESARGCPAFRVGWSQLSETRSFQELCEKITVITANALRPSKEGIDRSLDIVCTLRSFDR